MSTFATNNVPFNTNPNTNNCCYVPVWNGFGWQYVAAGSPSQPVNTTPVGGMNTTAQTMNSACCPTPGMTNTNCFPTFGYPNFNSSTPWQNCGTPMTGAFSYAHPFTQPWQGSTGWNSGAWNCNTTNTFNPYACNTNTCNTGNCGYPCFPFGGTMNNAWNTGWNNTPFNFGGQYGFQNCAYPQNFSGVSAGWNYPSYQNSFNQFNPWNSTQNWNNCPTSTWCNPFTQNCAPNYSPTNSWCAPTSCTPSFGGSCAPFNSWQNSGFNCGTPSGFTPNFYNAFNPTVSGWNNTCAPMSNWYGNSWNNNACCPTPSSFVPSWQNYNPFYPTMNTPWNFSPVMPFSGYGYPTNMNTPFPGATYPYPGFTAAAPMTGAPTSHRPTENGEMGYNLQRNAA